MLREAWRNIATGTTRTITLALLLSAASIGLAAADLLTVNGLAEEAEDFQRSGASIITLTAVGGIDGVTCEAMGHLPGVSAAGAIRATETGVVASALPSSTIPLMETSPGFAQVLRAERGPVPGLILSDQVSEALDLGIGDSLTTPTGRVPVGGTFDYPDDGRRAGYGYAVLAPVHANQGAFDECWVDAWPISGQIPALLRMTLIPTGDGAQPPVLSQLNTSRGIGFDGPARFVGRSTRNAPVAALVLGIGLGFAAVRTRRIQFAAALHAGASRRDLAAILGLEVASWTLPTAMFTIAIATFIAARAPNLGHGIALILGSRVSVLAVVGGFLGALAALLQVREHHLFRYFKER